MELPPYHLPTLKATLTHMFERGIMYLKKAGTFILLLPSSYGSSQHIQWM